jgi:hypothetical protein
MYPREVPSASRPALSGSRMRGSPASRCAFAAFQSSFRTATRDKYEVQTRSRACRCFSLSFPALQTGNHQLPDHIRHSSAHSRQSLVRKGESMRVFPRTSPHDQILRNRTPGSSSRLTIDCLAWESPIRLRQSRFGSYFVLSVDPQDNALRC